MSLERGCAYCWRILAPVNCVRCGRALCSSHRNEIGFSEYRCRRACNPDRGKPVHDPAPAPTQKGVAKCVANTGI